MNTRTAIRNLGIKLTLAFALVATPMVALGFVSTDSAPATIAGYGAPDDVDAG